METTAEKIMNETHMKLHAVAPSSARRILSYGVFNVLIGIFLFFQNARFAGDIAILTYIFNYQFWGVIFFVDGLLFFIAYQLNNWTMMTRLLLFSLMLKAFWEFALVARTISDPLGNVLLLVIWSKIFFEQFDTYVSFPPLALREVRKDVN